VICFEWLQRPEKLPAGFIRWTDYRRRDAPTTIRITHHKAGAVVLHPLEETIVGENGKPERVLFGAILGKWARRAFPMILYKTRDKVEDGKPKPKKLYSASGGQIGAPTAQACEAPFNVHPQSWWHDRKAELTDGPGASPVGTQESGLRRFRQASHGTRARRDAEASCTQTGEHGGNRCSE